MSNLGNHAQTIKTEAQAVKRTHQLFAQDSFESKLEEVSRLNVFRDSNFINNDNKIQEALMGGILKSKDAFEGEGSQLWLPDTYEKIMRDYFVLFQKANFINYLPIINEGGWADQTFQVAVSKSGEYSSTTSDGDKNKKIINVMRDVIGKLVAEYIGRSQYTFQDVQRFARGTNSSLPAELLKAHMVISQLTLNSVAIKGDTTNGIEGILQNTSITQEDSVATFSSLLTSNPLEIIKYIAKVKQKLLSRSGGNITEYEPNLLVLPVAQYAILTNTPVPTGPSAWTGGNIPTLMSEFEKMGMTVIADDAFKGAGTGGADVGLMLNTSMDNDNIKLEVPVPTMFSPTSVIGFDSFFDAIFRTTGIRVNNAGTIEKLGNI